MRVIVLGGAGGLARPAVRAAGRLPDVAEVVVAEVTEAVDGPAPP